MNYDSDDLRLSSPVDEAVELKRLLENMAPIQRSHALQLVRTLSPLKKVPASLGQATGKIRPRVLLIDDDSDILVSVGGFLESANLEVVRVSNGAEALDILSNGLTVDAVVTDAMMPGMSGVEFLEAARRSRPRLPALIITGNVSFGGSDIVPVNVAVLRKPFRRREFLIQVQLLLEQNAVNRGSR